MLKQIQKRKEPRISEQTAYIHLCTLKAALKLEILGMKRSRSPSAYMLIKQKLNITGGREVVLAKLESLIKLKKEALEEEHHHVGPLDRKRS